MAKTGTYKRNCRGCQVSRGNQALRNRIYNAQFKREQGDETLADIAKEVGISQPALYNHAKVHLATRDRDDTRKALILAKKTVDLKAAVAKKLEVSVDHEEVLAEGEAATALNEYVAQGHVMVKEGKIKITAQSFLQAVRISLDYESKKKDREVDIIKTMYRFSSGAKKGTDERKDTGGEGRTPAAGVAANTDRRPDGPGGLHNEDAGNAVTQWAAGLSPKYTKEEEPDKLTDVLQPLG